MSCGHNGANKNGWFILHEDTLETAPWVWWSDRLIKIQTNFGYTTSQEGKNETDRGCFDSDSLHFQMMYCFNRPDELLLSLNLFIRLDKNKTKQSNIDIHCMWNIIQTIICQWILFQTLFQSRWWMCNGWRNYRRKPSYQKFKSGIVPRCKERNSIAEPKHYFD